MGTRGATGRAARPGVRREHGRPERPRPAGGPGAGGDAGGRPAPQGAEREQRRLQLTWFREALGDRPIPRDRAIAGLELANAILDYEADSEPADPEGECEVTVEPVAWQRFLAFARKAAMQ